ncbi:alpha/beta hydrolase [Nakamurella flavida]|uniref:Alpha/beta hydrolase n=2 Tax=Nakamurella flavida TaxID=363630 RepID=A0A939BZG3_9ACTN|nr:alpha/beta hydrolase [Nakamurella flavida]
MRGFVSALTHVPDTSVGLVRYRVRGWNAPGQDPVDDVCAVLDGLPGRAPVVLVGHSMGGRAAVHAAGHPRVVGVVGLAPWLTDEDPVRTVQGRRVVLAHGARDRWVPASLSARWAERAQGVPDALARFVVPGDNHMMIRHPRRWHRLAVRATTALLGGTVDPVLARAWTAGAHGELAVPLEH